MGNSCASTKYTSSDNHTDNPGDTNVERGAPLSASASSSSSKKQSQPSSESYVDFVDIESGLKTGDLVLLYRHGNPHPHCGVVVDFSKSDRDFPLLLIKGKTRPLELSTFTQHKERNIRITDVATRIFYGDYEKVAIRKLMKGTDCSCESVIKIAEKVDQAPFSSEEIKAIEGADSPEQRSAVLCAFNLARIFHELGALSTDNPSCVRPDTLEEFLHLQEPEYIRLPPVKEGPLTTGDPPFLAKLALVCLSVCLSPAHLPCCSPVKGSILLMTRRLLASLK